MVPRTVPRLPLLVTIALLPAAAAEARAGDQPRPAGSGIVFEAGGAPAPAPAPDPGAPERLATALRRGYDRQSVEAAVEALARAGVATGADSDLHVLQEVAGRPSRYRYLEAQVRNMARQVAAGSGYSGAALNAALPGIPLPEAPGGAIPFSAVLAAWAAQADTFGAQFARALLGPIDLPRHAALTYPTLLIALLLADLGARDDEGAALAAAPPPHGWAGPRPLVVPAARLPGLAPRASLAIPASERGRATGPHLASVGTGARAREAGTRPAGAARDICADIDRFLDRLGDNVRDFLTPEGEGLLASVGTGIAVAAGVAVDVVVRLFRRTVLDSPVLAAVRQMLAGAALVAQAASLLVSWDVRVEPAPLQVHYGIGEPGEGRFVARVRADLEWEWPPVVRSCARLFELELPELRRPAGAEIRWRRLPGFDAHARASDETDTLDARGLDDYDYETRTESRDEHETGTPGRATIGVAVRVVRPEIELIKTLLGRVLRWSTFESLLPPELVERIQELVDPGGEGRVEVDFHTGVTEWVGSVTVTRELRHELAAEGSQMQMRLVNVLTVVREPGRRVSSRGRQEQTVSVRGEDGCVAHAVQTGEWQSEGGQLDVRADGSVHRVEIEGVSARVPFTHRMWVEGGPDCKGGYSTTSEGTASESAHFEIAGGDGTTLQGTLTRPFLRFDADVLAQIGPLLGLTGLAPGGGEETIVFDLRRVPRAP